MYSNEELYNQLKRAAWDAGISITELCKLAKVSRAAVSHWSTGRASPNIKTYNKLITVAEGIKNGTFAG
jgi:predicted transcriptional regulator